MSSTRRTTTVPQRSLHCALRPGRAACLQTGGRLRPRSLETAFRRTSPARQAAYRRTSPALLAGYRGR